MLQYIGAVLVVFGMGNAYAHFVQIGGPPKRALQLLSVGSIVQAQLIEKLQSPAFYAFGLASIHMVAFDELAHCFVAFVVLGVAAQQVVRSEEHTSELQSLMRISYAVFCLKKKTLLN